MIRYESHETISHVLTPEGVQIVQQGSHEARVWAALPAKGAGTPVTPAQLKQIIGDETAKVGQGRAFKNGWIAKDGDGLIKVVCQRLSSPDNSSYAHTVVVKMPSIEDVTQKELREVDSTGTLSAGEKSLADLRKRKLVVQRSGILSIRSACPAPLITMHLHLGKANGSLSTKGRILAPRPQSQKQISPWTC